MTIVLGADHGGWALKEWLKRQLEKAGWTVHDVSVKRPAADDDYPVTAAAVGQLVRRETPSRGIVVCRSGVGMAMAANKLPGIRAVQGVTVTIAERSRAEEDSNVLSLAADVTSRAEALAIAKRWLATRFRPVARYRRRIAQLHRLDHGRSVR